jgi:hypothetical protein
VLLCSISFPDLRLTCRWWNWSITLALLGLTLRYSALFLRRNWIFILCHYRSGRFDRTFVSGSDILSSGRFTDTLSNIKRVALLTLWVILVLRELSHRFGIAL